MIPADTYNEKEHQMFNIKPIKLLSGSHADTGKTGNGCFMNVISYLNGEPAITDQSPCVCVTVKPIAIWINDFMTDAERPQLLPYIMRAMGSATNDRDELVRRAWLCAEYAKVCAARAVSAESAASAAWAAMAASAESAASAARAAWAVSAESAASAAWAARAAMAVSAESAVSAAWAASAEFDYKSFRAGLISDTLKLLDDMLPAMTEPQAVHVERLNRLVELAHAD
jgi:hypothetical protein